jgi:hypothetical protein
MVNFEDLVSKGFVLIPNFLTDSELLTVKNHYNTVTEEFIKNPSLKNDYNILLVEPDKSLQFLLDKISNCISTVESTTDIKVNCIDNKVSYFDNKIFGSTGWHQDHGPYFKWKNLYNSLNFWIAVTKPDKINNGLSVIPYDTFPSQVRSKFIGKGAKSFEIIQKRTRVFDDANNNVFVLPYDINDYAISPEISEKDVLILRGDLIHKSQNLVSKRVALSIRSFHNG